MTRDRLPDRRAADLVSFEHEGRRWTVTAARFHDGRLAEIFLDAPQESEVADGAREAAILASIALQHGPSVETIRHALDAATSRQSARFGGAGNRRD